jgi:hypothetical protein
MTVFAESPAIPDTPAGRVLSAFLDSYNSEDSARIDAFVNTYKPDIEFGLKEFREQTGGFDLLAIEKNEKARIAFRVKERNSPTQAIGKIAVANGEPPKITNFSLYAVPPDFKFEEVPLDAAARTRVIDSTQRLLDEYYVFPDTAKKMIAAVRAKQKHGGYDALVDGDAFARQLTGDLRAVSHDKHLGTDFSLLPLPEDKPGEDKPDAASAARMREQLARVNCGFDKVEHLQPNIGYVKFNFFASPDLCGPTASAAMNFLADSDALIVDLRENGGGDPKMVAYVSSYLFDKRTHLNDLYNRRENKTEEYWTRDDVPGRRLAGKPVYVLTSARTFSGAEEFSYNLKNLKRATLIGETTGGGAHPVDSHRIDAHFSIGVPFARAINPVSKTNWEGVGVAPDVKVAASDALAEAIKLAQARLREKSAMPQSSPSG